MQNQAKIANENNNPLTGLSNNLTDYSNTGHGNFFSPFSFSIDKMEKLLLVNFEKDRDEYYNVFELQEAKNNDNIERLLVIAYRNDGEADIYYQPDYPLASQSDILNDASFFENQLEGAQFYLDANNLDAYFSFIDRYGRLIKVKVNELNRTKKKPFFLLAPVGVVAKHPSTLPVYSLYEMSFAKRKNTLINIDIDNKSHKPDNFFLPFDWSRNYFTRYSADTFNVDWNKNFEGRLNIITPNYKNQAEEKGIFYDVEDNKGHFEIKRIKASNYKHEIIIAFSPPVADIVSLRDQVAINGTFKISTDNSNGFINGIYLLKRNADQVNIQLHPSGGWQPNEQRKILKILFMLVKIFRTWPATYEWNAIINLKDPLKPTMKSGWKRVSIVHH